MPNKLAELQEDGPLEKPIEVVGEKVKSGQRVLADLDTATGAITIREKYRDYSEIILQRYEEAMAFDKAQGFNDDGEDDESTVEQLKQQEALAEQEEKAAAEKRAEREEDNPTVEGLDTTKLDPAVLAILERQQALLEKMAGAQNPQQAVAELSRQHGVIAEGRREIAKHRARVEDDLEFHKRTGCPRPPKKNPQHGDKTPKYVDWLKEHRPDVYEERYGVISRDKSYRKVDHAGNVVPVTTDIARRKVHTTEKPEEDPSLSGDMDWNA